MKQEGLRNIRPDQAPKRKKTKKGKLIRLLHEGSRWVAIAPAAVLLALGFLGGCGADPSTLLPRVDPLANVPNNSQTVLLASNAVYPASGPVGTVITVQGGGVQFPAGFAHFVFQGGAISDVPLEQASGAIRVRVPQGTASGSFGFEISGRPFGRDSTAYIPSDSNYFKAYTVPDPGFTVVPPPTIVSPLNQQVGAVPTNQFGN